MKNPTILKKHTNTEKTEQGVSNNIVILLCVFVCLSIGLWAGHQLWLPTTTTNNTIPSIVNNRSTLSTAPLISSLHPSNIVLGENTIADIAAAGAPSVVNINTTTSLSLPVTSFQLGLPFPGFEFFFSPGLEAFSSKKFESRNTGSGVIIKSNGYILTNNHVVGKDSRILVTLNDKRSFTGIIIGRDNFTDLALIKIDARGLPVAKFGNSKQLRPGDWAIAIGSPLGLDHTVTMGIISALGRSLDELNNNVELIQTDAAINPGNSGGPLLNIRGEVIGINTAIRSGAQNIGFAIPVDVAANVVDQLLSNGKVERPYIGIYMQELSPKLAVSLELSPDAKGVIVVNARSGSPAEAAGVIQGDVIQRLNGSLVNNTKAVRSFVLTHRPGDILNLLVYRGHKLIRINVKIGEYPMEMKDEME